jgi:hypothetical protein
MYVNPESLEDSGPFSQSLSNHFTDNFAGSQGFSREFLEFVCGPRLGHGVSREVFSCRFREDCVVKIETAPGHFANVQEAMLWHMVEGEENAKWFAPVLAVSSNGRVMLQKRTTPVPASFELPKMVPTFLTDMKRENFGMYKGRLVCHDYALNRVASAGLYSKRMMKASWT